MPGETPPGMEYSTPGARCDPVCATAVLAVLRIVVPFLFVIGSVLAILALRRAERFGGIADVPVS